MDGCTILIQNTTDMVLQGVIDRCAPVLLCLRDQRRRGSILSLVDQCHRLEILELSIHSKLDDMQLAYLILKNPLLKALHIKFIDSDDCTNLVAINGETLEELSIVTNAVSTTLSQGLMHLIRKVKKLKMISCNFADDETIELLSTKSTLNDLAIVNGSLCLSQIGMNSILNLENLTRVSLDCVNTWHESKFDVNQDFVVVLVSRCPLLEEIEFKGMLKVFSNFKR